MSWIAIGSAGVGMLSSMHQSKADAQIAASQGGQESQSWSAVDTPFANMNFNTENNALDIKDTAQQAYQRQQYNRLFQEFAQGGNERQRTATGHAEYLGAANLAKDFGMARSLDRMDSAGMRNYNTMASRNIAGMHGLAGMERSSAEGLQGMGEGMMMQGADRALGANFDALRDDRLSLLREQAAPQEERASNALAQKLFSMGQIGSEGGARQVEAFGEGLGRADLQRQLSAQDMADQMLQRERGFGMDMYGRGLGTLGQASASRSGAGSMYGQMFGMGESQFQAGQGFNAMAQARGQQRLQRTQDMFGFGSKTRDANLQRMGSMQTMLGNISAEQRSAAALAANISNAASGGAPGGPEGPEDRHWADKLNDPMGLFGGGVFSKGGLFSDIRLKENLREMGTVHGHKFYTWDWTQEAKDMGISQPGYGVIAQQVQAYAPEVISEKDGFLTVDYDALLS